MIPEDMAIQQEKLYNGFTNNDFQYGSCWFDNYTFDSANGEQVEFPGISDRNNYPEIDANLWSQIQKDEDDAIHNSMDGVRGRRRQPRRKRGKDSDEMKKQRMTHITVERNRRKQMNHYLAVIRDLMPPPYSKRGDQASIVGGAINFVKELEQHLQHLQAQHQHGHIKKRRTTISAVNTNSYSQRDQNNDDEGSVFSDFFQLPQYCSSTEGGGGYPNDSFWRRRGAADTEVRIIESHANLKIRCSRKPKQLLRLVAGLAALHLTTLHLHITTFDQTVLYSFNVKVEDGCKLSTVEEIATAVDDLMAAIQNQAVFD